MVAPTQHNATPLTHVLLQRRCAHQVFPTKSDDQIKRLIKALHQDDHLVVLDERRKHAAEVERQRQAATFAAVTSGSDASQLLGGVKGVTADGVQQMLGSDLDEDPDEFLCVRYEDLFQETSAGDQGMFCEELRLQHVQDFVSYRDHLEARLNAAVPLAAPGRVREVACGMAIQVLQAADPHKPAVDVQTLVARGFAMPVRGRCVVFLLAPSLRCGVCCRMLGVCTGRSPGKRAAHSPQPLHPAPSVGLAAPFHTPWLPQRV